MSTSTHTTATGQIIYPDSDGKPMAENTLQYEWIVTIKGGIADLFRDDPDVFVAGDLLWYPVEGDPRTCTAPDTMVAFGRPAGHRSSYKQWEEGGLAPQVVFEVLSHSNRPREMALKIEFYRKYGVLEYYVFDPNVHPHRLNGWLREGLDEPYQAIPECDGWISPRLGIRFNLEGGELVIHRPDGRRFLSFDELCRQADAAVRQADAAMRDLEVAELRNAQLREKLRALGVDPDA
ncbi:Uma2 family endonuclease [Isosphaeraceae bacterium EP7]